MSYKRYLIKPGAAALRDAHCLRREDEALYQALFGGAELPFLEDDVGVVELIPDGDLLYLNVAVANQDGALGPLYVGLDESPFSPDLTDYGENTRNVDAAMVLEFDDLPADFVSWSSLTLQIATGSTGFVADSARLYAVVVDELGNPLTEEVQVADSADADPVEKTVTFASATGSRTQWNSARLNLRWDYTPA